MSSAPQPQSVFPTLGEIGYTSEASFDQILRTYPDGSYRRYLNGTFNQRVVTVNLTSCPQATQQAVAAHFAACMTATGQAFEFVFYNPDETSIIDLSGTNTTGAYIAIYAVGADTRSQNSQATLEWTRVGKCRWSAQIPILLLAPLQQSF